MSEAAATSYDEVLYESQPIYSAHPDAIAVAARLRGIPARPASNCRVLELGCGTGGNLIPLAYTLAGSQFVGIDLSVRQVEFGREVCQRLNLANIDLKPISITDVDASWEKFDYIICHGVYSWVPRNVQDHILWICRNLLTPHGVAYVSYNTYPGWHLRNIVRDLMKYHAARFDDPPTKVHQARLVLRFLAKASSSYEGPMSRLLAKEAEMLSEEPDYYLYHEHLEDINSPLYFHEFVARARQAGLEYLCEAWDHIQVDSLPPEVRDTMHEISGDLIELEQFMDYLRSRTFRRTLLFQSETPVVRQLDPEVMTPMRLTALARPISERPDVISDSEEEFRLDNTKTAKTNNPLLKAALVELYRQWPGSMAFEELLTAAVYGSQLADEKRGSARAALAALLLRAHVSHLVAIQCEPFRFVHEISERPRASAVARLQAEEQARVTSMRHRVVEVDPLDRIVLQLADGTRTPEEIAVLADEQVTRTDQESNPAPLGITDVLESLRHLARSALLEA